MKITLKPFRFLNCTSAVRCTRYRSGAGPGSPAARPGHVCPSRKSTRLRSARPLGSPTQGSIEGFRNSVTHSPTNPRMLRRILYSIPAARRNRRPIKYATESVKNRKTYGFVITRTGVPMVRIFSKKFAEKV